MPVPLLAVLAMSALLAATVPATAASPGPTVHGPLTAPEGGPVDDGWLSAGDAPAWTQFDAEPPPGGGPVWPGVRRDARTTRVAGGAPVDVQILHLDVGAPVTIEPTLVNGTVGGVATVAAHQGDPLLGPVAGINGGFWLRNPFGEPNGFFALEGRLVSDAESQGVGPRGTVGWTADGRMLVDRVESREFLELPYGLTVTMNGVNRGHREHDELFGDGPDSLIAYTADYGRLVEARTPRTPEEFAGPVPVPVTTIRISVPHWPAGTSAEGMVTGITQGEGAYSIGPGEVVVVGTGAGSRQVDPLVVGDAVTLGTELQTLQPGREADWAGVVRALAGGPMIVKGGQMTAEQDWVDEGFEPHIHSNVRAPRTAIGVTADGRTLMVTADGRRPGISVGFTIAELARYMIALGAVEALSLDGGGSSQMVVDGVLRNNPCCDSSVRAVATSLQVVHDEPFARTDRHRGPGRVDTAGAVAVAAYPDGTRDAVLAVASGFPDAMAGGPLASMLGGPLLLTGSDTLPAVTRGVLTDLGVRSVVVLGGPAVIGPEVIDDLAAMGITATRVAGDSRFDTAAAVAERMRQAAAATPGQQTDRAFVAAAGTFPDALVAAGPGGMLGMPILLSEADRLHPATARALEGVREVVLVGGTSRLGPGLVTALEARGHTVTRLAGTSRFGTARAVNDWLADQIDLGLGLPPPLGLADGLVVATGSDFPDALAGGPLAAVLRVPLMIVPDGLIDGDPDTAAFFAELGPRSRVAVLGGHTALSSYQQWQLEELTR